MAFLDNSGDIILDAVLTDVGRKRMARGNFSITKFALGDDEIDYGLYNKDHPSGSAYYDLEILQTPILEAFTQANATLNYGLITYTRNDLLYLPTIKMNNKNTAAGMGRVVVKDSDRNVIYLADNEKHPSTSTTDTAATMLTADGLGANTLTSGTNSDGSKYILIETGIDSAELVSTSAMQNTYILGTGLNDSSFIVSFDKRYIASAFGPSGGSGTDFRTGTGGAGEISWSPAGIYAAGGSEGLENYSDVSANGVTNRLYPGTTDTTTTYSVIRGPRGAFTILNFTINSSISAEDFSKHGRRGSVLVAGSSNTYDYIDTIVYVRGISTNIVLQLPIRIIQAAQS